MKRFFLNVLSGGLKGFLILALLWICMRPTGLLYTAFEGIPIRWLPSGRHVIRTVDTGANLVTTMGKLPGSPNVYILPTACYIALKKVNYQIEDVLVYSTWALWASGTCEVQRRGRLSYELLEPRWKIKENEIVAQQKLAASLREAGVPIVGSAFCRNLDGNPTEVTDYMTSSFGTTVTKVWIHERGIPGVQEISVKEFNILFTAASPPDMG